MNKILFVGDPHVQVSNLTDCEALLGLIRSAQLEHKPDYVVISGDLFHTHAVLRLEVVNFWQKAASEISKNTHLVLMVGNHDMIGDRSKEGVMSALDTIPENPSITIVNRPMKIGEMSFAPYFSDSEAFVNETNELSGSVLFCHQTFQGSQYENGFYAPEGVDQDRLKFDRIISGHIHKTQKLGKVFYPGTPKWDTLSDANHDKGIWILSDSEEIFIDSSSVIEPIRSLTLTPEDNLSLLKVGNRSYVEMVGPSSWISTVSKKLKGKCKLTARPTDRQERRKLDKKVSSIFEYLESSSEVNDKKAVKEYLERL